MTEATFIDRVMLPVAPSWVARRVEARARVEAFLEARKYDGAGSGRRNDGWLRPATSANAETATAWRTLASSARELVRNNGHAANAVNLIANNTIGTGIRPSFHADSDDLERRLRELWEARRGGQQRRG